MVTGAVAVSPGQAAAQAQISSYPLSKCILKPPPPPPFADDKPSSNPTFHFRGLLWQQSCTACGFFMNISIYVHICKAEGHPSFLSDHSGDPPESHLCSSMCTGSLFPSDQHTCSLQTETRGLFHSPWVGKSLGKQVLQRTRRTINTCWRHSEHTEIHTLHLAAHFVFVPCSGQPWEHPPLSHIGAGWTSTIFKTTCFKQL